MPSKKYEMPLTDEANNWNSYSEDIGKKIYEAKAAGSLSAVLISIHWHEGSWLTLSTADCMQFSLSPLWAPNAMQEKRSGADFPSTYCPFNVNVCHGPRGPPFSLRPPIQLAVCRSAAARQQCTQCRFIFHPHPHFPLQPPSVLCAIFLCCAFSRCNRDFYRSV